ncbi:TPA: hypothetical protein LU109_003563 [Enterobacter hormaechei subsp. xiangfangensis]|nr:hypothetical protein [Enterobacter hormaechei subsp. xiangfangensis]
MKHQSATNFEMRFRLFLDVKRKWVELVNKHAQYHSHNAFNQRIRPIVVTTDPAILWKAQGLINEWTEFANYADAMREEGAAGVTKKEYSPVPFIIRGSVTATINEGSAQTIHNMTREKIISMIERQLRIHAREGHEDTPDVIDLKVDLERFSAYPPGTAFRRRLTGYNDTLINTRNKLGEDVTHRVAQHGVIFDSSELTQPIKYLNNEKSITPSIYDKCKPIPCSLYETSSIYLRDDVLKAKEARKVELHPSTAYIRRKQRRLAEQYSQPSV